MTKKSERGPWVSRLRPADVIATGTAGIRTRRTRSAFTAAGIAIGIASMVAVLGISTSSKADLLAELDRLGTNLLEVRPGTNSTAPTSLTADAPAMVRRVGPVEEATSIGLIPVTIQRSDLGDTTRKNGISVMASEVDLAVTLGATASVGRAHDAASVRLPTVVLGSVAADRLGVDDLATAPRVWVGNAWFDVIGVLDPMPLNPDLDRAAFVGFDAARQSFDVAIPTTRIFLRTAPENVGAVSAVLAKTVSPGSPQNVEVFRPSDALAARAEVDANLQTLLLALGGVALVVGGAGIANVMVISVLERRGEIGVRRALGATRRHIRNQFLVESTLLSLVGGVLGVTIGFAVTAGYAVRQGWQLSIPPEAVALGIGSAVVVGALAGLYPAAKASRLDPAEAVRPAA